MLSIEIFTALFYNFNSISFTILQSLDKFKTVYLSTLIGYLTNALLDIPLMLLCYKLKIMPFYGALISSIIGLSLSTILALIKLKKDHHLKYKETVNILKKIIIPTIIMTLVVVLLKLIIPYNLTSKMSCIIYVLVTSIIGSAIYLYLLAKNQVLFKVLGKKKLTLGKVNLF